MARYHRVLYRGIFSNRRGCYYLETPRECTQYGRRTRVHAIIIRPHSRHAQCQGILYLLIPAVSGTVTPLASQVTAVSTRMHNWPKSCNLFCFEHVHKGKRTALECCPRAFGVLAGLHPPSPRHFAWRYFSVSLTNLMALLPQSHDFSCYVSRLLAPPPLWRLKHDDTHTTSCTLANCGINLGSLTPPAPEAGNCGITPATHYLAGTSGRAV